MGVDVDAGPLGLLQQFLEGLEAVAGHQDPTTLPRSGLHLRGFRFAVRLDVSLLQELHRLDVHFAGLERKPHEITGVEVHVRQRRVDGVSHVPVYRGVRVSKLPRVEQISGHAFQAEDQVVLEPGNRGFLATYSFHRAAGPPRRL